MHAIICYNRIISEGRKPQKKRHTNKKADLSATRGEKEKAMKHYYYNNFRGFANEFEIISVEQDNPKERELFEDFRERYLSSSNPNWVLDRITFALAKKMIRRERGTKRAYEKAGLNLCCNPVGATEITTATEFLRCEEW